MRRLLDELARRPALVDWLVLVIAVALPCRYLLPLGSDYYYDWANHQWAIGYTGEFFRHHGTMPAVFNTSEIGGLAVPVFYGNLFYPVMGFVARWSSPELAIRIGVLALYAVQFRLVSKALVRVGAPRYLAHGVACLVIWAIYPLTNLYNRGALTEFFATGLLVCALALLVLVCRADNAGQRRRHASAMLLALTLAAGTHPITALFGIPTFVALGGVFCWMLRAPASRIDPTGEDPRPACNAVGVPTPRAPASRIAASIAPWLGLAALCVAPWLYATASYAGHLTIRHLHPDVVFFPEAMDAWSTRFWPLPLDPRVAPGTPLGAVSTPYLDAQINMALLIVFVVIAMIAIRATRGGGVRKPLVIVLAVVAALFGVFTAMSLVPGTYRVLPALTLMIQFAYRAVTYQNLALLAGVFLLVIAVPELANRLGHPGVRAAVAACVVLSGAGVVVKWQHIAAVQHDRAGAELIHLPVQYYGIADYATEDLFTPLGPEPAVAGSFAFDAGARFGLAIALAVDLPESTWIATNVQSFPWNAISIDGTRVAATELRTANGKLVVRVPPGNHKLAVRLAPPAIWRVLRIGSLLGLGGWWLALLAELALVVRARHRAV
jgi:hypothetical protein